MRAVKLDSRVKKCVGTLNGQYNRGQVCGTTATHMVDGQPYCFAHAGKQALFILCTEVGD